MTKRFAVLFFSLAVGLATLTAQTTSTTTDPNPTGDTGALKSQVQTGGSYDAHSGNASRIVNDLKVPGALGGYGLDFTRYWNSLNFKWDNAFAETPEGFGWSVWSHSWGWSAIYEEVPPTPVRGTDYETNQYVTAYNITFPDGHTTRFKIVRLGHAEGGVEGSVWWGPPYTPGELQEFAKGGDGVHDHICNMNPNTGADFDLCLADGGSVHFANFVATEVFDPHGFRTGLSYNADGNLEYIEQDGGRFIKLTWEYFSGGGSVITKVEGGTGPNRTGINQTVTYQYVHGDGSPQSSGSTSALVLQNVIYENEPDPTAPGQKVTATYSYGGCWDHTDQYPGECAYPNGAPVPLLQRADDPHFAGPMAIIRYSYRGEACPTLYLPPEYHPNYIHAQPYAIAAEKSDSGVTVSSFAIGCDNGLRTEHNGLGGWRMFYFGAAAGTDFYPATCRGYELGKLTDFTGDPSQPITAPYDKQNYISGHPFHIWDGRNIMTEATYNGQDDSGQPAQINYADTSHSFYNRTDPGYSAPIDPAQGMHNSYNHWLFSHTDELGHITNYKRDARRRVYRIEYTGGSAEEFAYNDSNQVTSHTLASGAVVTYEYDGRGLLQRAYNSIDGWDARKEYIYDDPFHPDLPHKVIDARARSSEALYSTRMEYDGANRVVEVHYAPTLGSSDPHITYGYDAYGNCTWISDELAQYPQDPAHTKRYQYDVYRRCVSYTEPLNAPDAWDNNMPSRRWDWVYDRYIVDENYNPIGGGSKNATAHTVNSWRIQVEPAFNSLGERSMTHRFHDVNNRPLLEQRGWIQRAAPAAIGDWYWSGQGETVFYTYDENGQKKSYTDPQGRITTYEYDNRNRLWKTNETVNTIPRTTETLYDWAGNKTMLKFPVEAAGQRTQQWLDYDAFGQPWRFLDERGNTTNLTYCWGPMKKLYIVTTHRDKDGGGTEDQQTIFSYDLMGKPTQVRFPDGTHEDTTYNCKDGVGYLCEQPHTWWNRKGQIKYFHYDARGREDSNSWANIDGICDPAADNGPAPCIARQWDSANRLVSIANIFSSIDYAYDDAGQVLREGNTIAGSSGRMQTSYRRYGDGKVAYLQYPDGLWVNRQYTVRGQLSSVSDSFVGWQQVVGYNYLPDGKVNYQDYGNDTRTAFEYDGRGMTSLISIFRLSEYQNYSWRQYWRDERDRITAFQKSTNNAFNPMENGHGDRFRYDEEGQLLEAWYNAANPAVSGDGYTRYDGLGNYDALGNRSGWEYVSSRGWLNFSRKDNGLNEYRGWMPFSMTNYDDDIGGSWGTPQHANGVLMQDGNITAGYNALNQPMLATSNALSPNWMFFGYDPLGRCVRRWTGQLVNGNPPLPDTSTAGTYFYYDGWSLIEEAAAGSASRYYVHGARVDEIVKQMIQYNPAPRFFHYDARGHCTLQTDASGNIAEQYEYDAFGYPYFYDAGGTYIGYSPWGNRFLFTGREYISELKLYDYRNRMYQPELGRFMQPDPKEFAAGDYNLYRYCHNDPVNRSDPTGLLTYKFEAGFPVNTPGGKKIIERAIEKYLRKTERGRQLLNARGTVVIRQVNESHPTTGTSFDPRKGSSPDFETFFDPTDSRFQDRTTFRQLYKHPGELPPDNDKGRAAIIGHEFEHGVDKILNEIQTIKKGENPVRDELEIPLRHSSNGEQIPYPYK